MTSGIERQQEGRPRSWFDSGPLFGYAGAGKADDLNARSWFAGPGRLRAEIERLATDFSRAEIYSVLDSALPPAWRDIPAEGRPPLHLVVPNVRSLIREATEHGVIGAGMRRLFRIGLANLVRLSLASLPETKRVLQRDFPTLLRILTRMELTEARRLRPRSALLQQQMTDLAVGKGRPDILAGFIRQVRRDRLAPGLVTANPAYFGPLLPSVLEALGEGDDEPITVVVLRGSAEACRHSCVRLVEAGVTVEGEEPSSLHAVLRPWPIEREGLQIGAAGTRSLKNPGAHMEAGVRE